MYWVIAGGVIFCLGGGLTKTGHAAEFPNHSAGIFVITKDGALVHHPWLWERGTLEEFWFGRCFCREKFRARPICEAGPGPRERAICGWRVGDRHGRAV